MKKLLAISILALTAFTATAADFYGSVGVDSNYIYRGQTYSNDGISPNATVGAGTKLGTGTAYVQMNTNYVDFSHQGSGAKFRNNGTVGFKNTLGAVAYSVELNRAMFSGNTVAGVKSSALDNTTIDLAAEYKGVFGKYSKDLSTNTGNANDTWYQIGYHTTVMPGLDVGIAAAQKHYDLANVTRYNNTEFTAAYDLTKQVKIVALYSLGGKDVTNADIANKVSAGVKYSF